MATISGQYPLWSSPEIQLATSTYNTTKICRCYNNSMWLLLLATNFYRWTSLLTGAVTSGYNPLELLWSLLEELQVATPNYNTPKRFGGTIKVQEATTTTYYPYRRQSLLLLSFTPFVILKTLIYNTTTKLHEKKQFQVATTGCYYPLELLQSSMEVSTSIYNTAKILHML